MVFSSSVWIAPGQFPSGADIDALRHGLHTQGIQQVPHKVRRLWILHVSFPSFKALPLLQSQALHPGRHILLPGSAAEPLAVQPSTCSGQIRQQLSALPYS